ncbi:MAG: hypothetical protein Alpg2KO_08490 [Alphaproteobacteria bacterium]
MVWVLGAVIAGLVVLYLFRPRFPVFIASAARFMENLPGGAPRRRRFTLTAPLKSPAFWLQLLAFLALLGAALSGFYQRSGTTVGLWVVLDRSYSMAAVDSKGARMDRAQQAVADAVTALEALPDAPSCLRLSAFDLQVQELWTGTDPQGLLNAAQAVEPAPRGTDLSLLRSLAVTESPEDCPLTHLMIISDEAAPSLSAPQPGQMQVIWQDIGAEGPNLGLGTPVYLSSPFGASKPSLAVSLIGTGAGRLIATGPDGRAALDQSLGASGQARLLPEPAGEWQLELRAPERDAYPGDDLMLLDVPETRALTVDWRLPEQRLLRALGWRGGRPDDAALAVARDDPGTATPLLLVGPGWRGALAEDVALFEPDHALLDAVNLDVADALPLPGIRPPEGFRPVAMTGDSRVLIALRTAPRAVWLPGLPIITQPGPEAATTQLLFFNAIRWLLGADFDQLDWQYVTEQGQPIEGGASEWRDKQEVRSTGSLSALADGQTLSSESPAWPIWLMIAALLIALERVLAGYRAGAWR